MSRPLLAVNRGSSSLKWVLFDEAGARRSDEQNVHTADDASPERLASDLISGARAQLGAKPLAIVHRIVHGGATHYRPCLVTPSVVDALRQAIPLAPNHLPPQVDLLEALAHHVPDARQVVTFDTGFHHDLPELSRTLPLPAGVRRPELRRWGFHGLSYRYLLQQLTALDPGAAAGSVVLAHLGSGASCAAVQAGRPIDTTMGMTPTGGLIMSSRSGDLDPGVVTYLARTHNLSADQLDRLLTHESGLIGVSETTADMRQLVQLAGHDPRARLAIDLFCYQLAKFIGAFAVALGGLDTVVFSGGIGEHSDVVRANTCARLAVLGVQLNSTSNAQHAAIISEPGSRVVVRVIATDEAAVMVADARAVLDRHQGD